jgi:hypothetical protein
VFRAPRSDSLRRPANPFLPCPPPSDDLFGSPSPSAGRSSRRQQPVGSSSTYTLRPVDEVLKEHLSDDSDDVPLNPAAGPSLSPATGVLPLPLPLPLLLPATAYKTPPSTLNRTRVAWAPFPISRHVSDADFFSALEEPSSPSPAPSPLEMNSLGRKYDVAALTRAEGRHVAKLLKLESERPPHQK